MSLRQRVREARLAGKTLQHIADEFGPVFRAVTNRLIQLVETRDNFPEALFKVLWRFDNCRVGPPSYPREINWQLITDYLNGP